MRGLVAVRVGILPSRKRMYVTESKRELEATDDGYGLAMGVISRVHDQRFPGSSRGQGFWWRAKEVRPERLRSSINLTRGKMRPARPRLTLRGPGAN
jgi:hypothetical protein